MLFHIGEVPGYPDQPDKGVTTGELVGLSNRKMIQANLYTLCLNALMSDEENEESSA